MSKLGLLKQQRGVYGDPAIPIIGGLLAAGKAALGAIGIGGAAKAAAALAKRGIAKYGTAAVAGAAIGRATAPRASVNGTGYKRRAKGITASELRGFKKMNRLLWCVGMVPKKARSRKVC